ncbi:hypothetical protein RRG08_013217 [Elysia crispata]|uniref:Uncharacterized protein n=1 Tax=Elysia crispata TaxID=231223 RepID=A0AAE1AGW7_9GAST|nr:hypothetical protein RRG08_013217 [Elysia crispata]
MGHSPEGAGNCGSLYRCCALCWRSAVLWSIWGTKLMLIFLLLLCCLPEVSCLVEYLGNQADADLSIASVLPAGGQLSCGVSGEPS